MTVVVALLVSAGVIAVVTVLALRLVGETRARWRRELDAQGLARQVSDAESEIVRLRDLVARLESDTAILVAECEEVSRDLSRDPMDVRRRLARLLSRPGDPHGDPGGTMRPTDTPARDGDPPR